MIYRFILPNVFSCSFTNTAIAEVDEKNLRDGSRVPGMSSKIRFVFLLFFQKTSSLGRKSLYSGKNITMEQCQQTGQFPPNVIMGAISVIFDMRFSLVVHYTTAK